MWLCMGMKVAIFIISLHVCMHNTVIIIIMSSLGDDVIIICRNGAKGKVYSEHIMVLGR